MHNKYIPSCTLISLFFTNHIFRVSTYTSTTVLHQNTLQKVVGVVCAKSEKNMLQLGSVIVARINKNSSGDEIANVNFCTTTTYK